MAVKEQEDGDRVLLTLRLVPKSIEIFDLSEGIEDIEFEGSHLEDLVSSTHFFGC